MDLPSQAIIDALVYLLPGFITAEITYNLTPSPRPVAFERIVQALIATIVLRVCVLAVKASFLLAGVKYGVIGNWTTNIELVWSVVLAIVLGLIVAYCANSDRLHSVLRQKGLTFQSSYSSEWYGVLAQNRGYVVLHLVDKRRIYGWPQEWPSTPTQGHFVLAQAEWLIIDEKSQQQSSQLLTGVEKILIKAADVEMIEFMQILPPQEEG